MGGLSATVPDGMWGPECHFDPIRFDEDDRRRRFEAKTVTFDKGVLRIQFLPLSFAVRRDLVRNVLSWVDAWQPNGH